MPDYFARRCCGVFVILAPDTNTADLLTYLLLCCLHSILYNNINCCCDDEIGNKPGVLMVVALH